MSGHSTREAVTERNKIMGEIKSFENIPKEKFEDTAQMKKEIWTRISFRLPDNGNKITCILINATPEQVNYVIRDILKKNGCFGKVELAGDNIFYYGKENSTNPIGNLFRSEKWQE